MNSVLGMCPRLVESEWSPGLFFDGWRKRKFLLFRMVWAVQGRPGTTATTLLPWGKPAKGWGRHKEEVKELKRDWVRVLIRPSLMSVLLLDFLLHELINFFCYLRQFKLGFLFHALTFILTDKIALYTFSIFGIYSNRDGTRTSIIALSSI